MISKLQMHQSSLYIACVPCIEFQVTNAAICTVHRMYHASSSKLQMQQYAPYIACTMHRVPSYKCSNMHCTSHVPCIEFQVTNVALCTVHCMYHASSSKLQ